MSGNITAVQTGSGWDVDQTGTANLQGDLQPDGSIKLDSKGSAAVAAALIPMLGAYNVKNYGAKCDGRAVTDANIGAATGGNTCSITSATIAFTGADVGKLFILNDNSLTTTYSPASGVIVSVESSTSATVRVNYTTSAITGNHCSLAIGTDDSAAIASAISSASVIGGTVVFPIGLTMTSQRLDISGRVNFKGLGKPKVNGNKFMPDGSTVLYAGLWSGSAIYRFMASGVTVQDMGVDAAAAIDGALQFDGVECRIYNAMVGRSLANLILAYGSSMHISGSELFGADRGTAFYGGGDAIITGNYIFGGGSGSPTFYAKNATDDMIVCNNHFFRSGLNVSLPNVPGPHIKVEQSATTTIMGGTIGNNVFDTCEGNAIELLVSSSAAGACEISGLSISDNQFYQPQPFTSNTYSCINVKAGDGGAQNALIRGLSITGNVGKGNAATSRAWKSFINWDIQATYGLVIADSVVGNTINNCNAGYTASATAHTPGYTAGNFAIAGTGTTATAF